jgi:hypothetical protein
VSTSPSPGNAEEFRAALSRAIARASSLADITSWLSAQPYVHSVRLEDFLMKSYPPQRRLTVVLRLPGSLETRRAIDVYTHDDERFELREIHDV